MSDIHAIATAVGDVTRAPLAATLEARAVLLGGGGGAASAGAPADVPVSSAATGSTSRHAWVAQPMHGDAAIREQTGLGWDDWIDRIDGSVGRDAAHPTIVEWVMANSQLNGWWAQGIAVSYERMIGRRLAGQMPDGTFTANRSRTLVAPKELLRELIADDAARSALLDGLTAELRSKPASKTFRVLIGTGGGPLGALLFSFDPAANGRTKLAVMHEKLQLLDEIELWKGFWGTWLDALEGELARRP